jgi:hypothetical protein
VVLGERRKVPLLDDSGSMRDPRRFRLAELAGRVDSIGGRPGSPCS